MHRSLQARSYPLVPSKESALFNLIYGAVYLPVTAGTGLKLAILPHTSTNNEVRLKAQRERQRTIGAEKQARGNYYGNFR
jgi:hypothetical protein